MQRLMSILKSRYFLIGLGTALLIALVWVGGAWMGWPMTWRLGGVIAVLLVCMIGLLVSVVRANRAAAGIEQSIKQQAEAQKRSARPDQRAEVEELEKRLTKALDTLKNSKLGRGRRGSAALYALPWYLFVGPPGAGKTTAITESGLNFPIESDRVRGVGGTRNCDWFFSDEAILLDTAGRYMTEAEDEEEWHAFLDMLREHRSDRPVNGVLVGISVAKLADADPEDIEWHAERIRRRIDELIERLGVRFPVYLVFTKCDLLNGFVEFFGELPRKEREQLWGHTFEHTPEAEQDQEDAEEEEQAQKQTAAGDDLRGRFERAFDPLAEALTDRRTERLSRSMKREDRRKVYAFPLEFSAVKEPLAHFVDRLFQSNPYQENPIFRGFYFTSGTQEGAPLDRVIQSVGQQFDLPPEQEASFDPEMETKSYFLKDLFTDVVIPDQYLVSQTAGVARKGWLKRAGATVAAVVLLGLFVLGASQALVRSQLRLGDVEEAAEAVRAVDWANASSMPDAFARMDRLRREVAQLERRETDPPLLSWGLSRDGKVLAPAQKLYHRKVSAFIQAYPFQRLERRLSQAARRSSATGARREALYADLRAYLLMSDAAKRLKDEPQRTFLKRYLTRTLDSTLLRTASVPQERQNAFSKQIRKQVAAFVGGLREDTARAFRAKPALVAGVRNRIYQEPSIAGLYRRIKKKGNATMPAFALKKAVQARDLPLFATKPQVPGVFTKSGWENFAKAAIEKQGETANQGDWVLGHTTEDVPEAMRNRDQVVKKLKARYFEAYASQWKRFLRNVQFKQFGDLSNAVRAMSRLASPTDSPVLRLLAQVSDQTTFKKELSDQAKSQVKKAGKQAANRKARRLTRNSGADVGSGGDDKKTMHPVNRRFAMLHDLKAPRAVTGGASSTLKAGMEALRRVRSQLEKMRSGGDGKAAEYAAQVLDENGGDIGSALGSIRRSMNRLDTQMRRSLFDQPLLYSWSAILRAAQDHLNKRWRAAVHQPFQNKLASSYPFDMSSSRGAPVANVKDFFHPQRGVVSTFFENELGPFLGRDMKPRTWENRGLRLSSSARRALQQVQRIREGLFRDGVLSLSFELQPELTQSSDTAPPVDQVYVSINGKTNTYRNGSYRPWVAFTWPGNGGVQLSVSTREGELPPKQFDGSWAWFRLLQKANVQRKSPTVYDVQWPFKKPGRYTIFARYNLRTQSSSSPFGDVQGFFNLRLPPKLN